MMKPSELVALGFVFMGLFMCALILLVMCPGCAMFGGSSGDGIRTDPASYIDQMLIAKDQAYAGLNTVLPYNIWNAWADWGDTRGMLITVVPGQKKINGYWCIPSQVGNGWVMGEQNCQRIWLASDPTTGVVLQRAAIHEWAHAILWLSHVPDAEQHPLMKRAGIY